MLYLALAVSVFGLLLIAYVSPSVKPPVASVSDVSPSSVEKAVRVWGKVTSAKVFKGGSVLITLSDGAGSLDVYVPYSVSGSLRNMSLTGRFVEAQGTVQLYNGKLELVVGKPEMVAVR
jgi:DNA/RNA endonuclease YhcR with UshA esterase domain